MKTSVLPLDAVPRAIVNRETTGVFKLVADAETLKVLGFILYLRMQEMSSMQHH